MLTLNLIILPLLLAIIGNAIYINFYKLTSFATLNFNLAWAGLSAPELE